MEKHRYTIYKNQEVIVDFIIKHLDDVTGFRN